MNRGGDLLRQPSGKREARTLRMASAEQKRSPSPNPALLSSSVTLARCARATADAPPQTFYWGDFFTTRRQHSHANPWCAAIPSQKPNRKVLEDGGPEEETFSKRFLPPVSSLIELSRRRDYPATGAILARSAAMRSRMGPNTRSLWATMSIWRVWMSR